MYHYFYGVPNYKSSKWALETSDVWNYGRTVFANMFEKIDRTRDELALAFEQSNASTSESQRVREEREGGGRENRSQTLAFALSFRNYSMTDIAGRIYERRRRSFDSAAGR